MRSLCAAALLPLMCAAAGAMEVDAGTSLAVAKKQAGGFPKDAVLAWKDEWEKFCSVQPNAPKWVEVEKADADGVMCVVPQELRESYESVMPSVFNGMRDASIAVYIDFLSVDVVKAVVDEKSPEVGFRIEPVRVPGVFSATTLNRFEQDGVIYKQGMLLAADSEAQKSDVEQAHDIVQFMLQYAVQNAMVPLEIYAVETSQMKKQALVHRRARRVGLPLLEGETRKLLLRGTDGNRAFPFTDVYSWVFDQVKKDYGGHPVDLAKLSPLKAKLVAMMQELFVLDKAAIPVLLKIQKDQTLMARLMQSEALYKIRIPLVGRMIGMSKYAGGCAALLGTLLYCGPRVLEFVLSNIVAPGFVAAAQQMAIPISVNVGNMFSLSIPVLEWSGNLISNVFPGAVEAAARAAGEHAFHVHVAHNWDKYMSVVGSFAAAGLGAAATRATPPQPVAAAPKIAPKAKPEARAVVTKAIKAFCDMYQPKRGQRYTVVEEFKVPRQQQGTGSLLGRCGTGCKRRSGPAHIIPKGAVGVIDRVPNDVHKVGMGSKVAVAREYSPTSAFTLHFEIPGQDKPVVATITAAEMEAHLKGHMLPPAECCDEMDCS